MAEDLETVVKQFVDYLMPELTPYETSLYLYLLRNSLLNDGSNEVRVGKRTIAVRFGRGARAEKTSYAHVSETIRGLEQRRCVKVGDTHRDGTRYVVTLPKDVPLVGEKMASLLPHPDTEEDYFADPNKRREIFERDKWICQYCGEKVTEDNITLDHYVPQSTGGKPTKDNLRTSCLICNAIKSGKTFEEAAPFLVKSIQERKARSHN